MKNMMNFSVGALIYWAIVFVLMFDVSDGFLWTTHFFTGVAKGGQLCNCAFWMNPYQPNQSRKTRGPGFS